MGVSINGDPQKWRVNHGNPPANGWLQVPLGPLAAGETKKTSVFYAAPWP